MAAGAEQATRLPAEEQAAVDDGRSLGLRPSPSAWAGFALTLSVAGAIFWIAFDRASFSLASRSSLAIAAWWILIAGVASTALPRERIPRSALAVGLCLLAFALFTALSLAWAESDEKAFNEFNRSALYLGVFGVAVVLGRRRHVARWCDGLALAITAVGLLALASRFFPSLVGLDDPIRFLKQTRLAYPIGYWTGLSILVALGLPFLLRAAVASRRPALRGLAVAPLPALVVVLYLTSSRVGVGAALLAAALFFVFTARRFAAAGALVTGSLGAAAALAVVLDRPELVDPPVGRVADADPSAALAVALLCLLTGSAYAIAARFAPAPPRVGAWLRMALWGGAALAAALGLWAAEPRERFESFRQPSAGVLDPSVREHLFSLTSSGRWQLWNAALDEFESRPLVGRGAGSFAAWWAEHGTIPGFVQDAHSLYLEVLGELGLVGLALLGGALLLGLLVAGRRTLAWRQDSDQAVPALAAALVTFLVVAGVDWMWELTVVTVVGMVFLGLLTGPATALGTSMRMPERAAGKRRILALRGALALLGVGFVVTQAIPLLVDAELRGSQQAIARGDEAAASRGARSARRLQPWAASPYLQLALVEEERGDLEAARGWIEEALERDRTDWRLWLVSARLETGVGRVAEARRRLARARALNPRSPIFTRT